MQTMTSCIHRPTLENVESFGNNDVSLFSKKRRTRTLELNGQLSELNWYKTSKKTIDIE